MSRKVYIHIYLEYFSWVFPVWGERKISGQHLTQIHQCLGNVLAKCLTLTLTYESILSFSVIFHATKKGLNNFYMSTRIISDTNTATKRGNLAWISRNVGQKAFVGINNENEKNNAELVAIQTKTNKTTKCHKCQQKV